MGAPRDYSRQHKEETPDDRMTLGEWHSPLENPARDGCSGAQYRGEFMMSLLPYRRRQDPNGGRISNTLLDNCENPLVHQAINALEALEDAALSEARAKYESMKK